MKKKLIAAVTSLAMVATMVPATAFAAVDAGTVDKEATTQVAQTKDAAQAKAADELSQAAQDFVKAMNEIGSTTSVSSYSKGMDTLITDACQAYIDCAGSFTDDDKANDTVKAKISQLESLVQSEWTLRIQELNKMISPLSGIITPTSSDVENNSIAAIGNLQTEITEFYMKGKGSTEANAMYTVLGEKQLNIAVSQKRADNTLEEANNTVLIAQRVQAAALAIAKIPEVDDENYRDSATIEAIEEAKDKYEAIKTNGPVTNADGTTIATVEDLQKKVNYNKVTVADQAVTKLKKEVEDALKILERVDATSVPTKDNIDSITDKYKAGKAAYDGLKAGQKKDSEVKAAKTTLDTAKKNIDAYNEGAKKEEEVQSLLTNLPNGSNAADALTIAQAQVAYDKLSKKAATDVDDAGLAILKAGYQGNVAGSGKLMDAVKAIKATIFPRGTADATAVAAAVKPVQDLISALPASITTSAEKNQALDAYDAYEALLTLDSGKALEKALDGQLNTLMAAKAAADKLNKTDEAAISEFIKAVELIQGSLSEIDEGDTVDTAYKVKTADARASYDNLTEEQKKMVAENAVENAKNAYDKLLVAEANVTSESKLMDVAKLIKAVPEASKLDVTDSAAVQKVKDAQAAYEALSSGAKELLVNDEYVTSKQMENYKNAVKKVTTAENQAAAKTVIDAIKALPNLPTTFTSQSEIEAANTAVTQAEEAYKVLTDAQKAFVTNYSDLTNYRTNYDALVKKYVDPLYAETAKIDVTKELTTEDIAKIAELKAYVDGKCIDTKNITGFDQKVYDALVEALDKAQKNEKALENATIAPIADQAYTGKAIEPAVTVTDKTGAVVDAKEYTIIYSNNVNVGEAKVVVAANSGSAYTGTASATFQIIRTTTSIASATVGDIADKTYTGSAIKPAVSVKLGNDTLKAGTDYTVAYKNNTKLGKATVTITGTGNYTGTITKSFIIKPAKESITSVKGGKGKITVAYKTQNKAKYRIITKKSGTKAKGTNTLATSKTVKNLKKGTYQVKVRAYKVIDGKTYYGAYSAVKTVKVK